MRNLENTTLGRYDLIREVGRGTMGTVYLGHDPFSGLDVAVKVADPESLKDEQDGARFRKMFFNEAKVAGRLKHPNIVSVYDAGVHDDICYIVMEYIAGGRTLYDQSKPDNLLPMQDVVRMIFKCAKALDYAHRKGVVHRDVKPRNILLTDDNDVKIGDFSAALTTRLDATETQVHGYIGSPLYMSPEQVKEETVTGQTDIFALGVVLYEMLTGKHPFVADSLVAIIHNITGTAHTPIRELRSEAPKVIAHIVDRCLQKDSAHRYRNCMDLAADLTLVFDDIELSGEEVSGREKFDSVKELNFFRDFTDPETWEVINASIWQEYEAGASIFLEGDLDNSFYIIVSGEVGVRKGETWVDILSRGDCFGEMGFVGNQRRTADIVAQNRVAVMKVRSALIEQTSLNCQLRFHKVFLNTMVRRLSRATEKISEQPSTPSGH